MSCKHGNCTIWERSTVITQFEVANGNASAGHGDESDGNMWLEVNCHDCGLIRNYKKIPKWLKAYHVASVVARDGRAYQKMLDDEFDEEYA